MVERRPVTVAVAINLYFFYYGEGVLENCGTELNHAVFVTGFVESREENFWIVKNSWGTWWGMQGYAHINRAVQYGNLCEICYAPSYSIL
jgi:cathepsin L